MYTYKNKKTGAMFSSSVKCAGGDWEQVGQEKAAHAIKPEAAPAAETAENPEAEPVIEKDEGEGNEKQKKARK